MSISQSGSSGSEPPRLGVAPVRQLSVAYLGFRSAGDRREYRLNARLGTDSFEYVVSIPNAAFAEGHFKMQDGPGICFEKLRSELAGTALTGPLTFEMTASELTAYRDAHAPQQRRSAAAKPANAGAPGFGAPAPFPPLRRG